MTEIEHGTSMNEINTDRLVWQKDPINAHSPSVYITEEGELKLIVHERPISLPVETWHGLATTEFKRFEFNDKTSFVLALSMLNDSYKLFSKIGQKEIFLTLAKSIALEDWTLFFGSFGNDKGCFLNIKASDVPGEMILNFGVRSAKRGWLQRIKDAFSGFNKDPEYEIHLSPEEVTRFKSLVSSLKGNN